MFNAQSFLEIDALVAQLWQGVRSVVKPYGYPVSINNGAVLAINSQVTQYQKINANADFLLMQILYNCTDASDPVGVKLQVFDTGAQAKFFDSPVLLNSVASYGASTGCPRKIAANSNLELTVYTTGVALPAGSQIYLSGVLVYPLSN